jgi:PAS domain S-box-containing protein
MLPREQLSKRPSLQLFVLRAIVPATILLLLILAVATSSRVSIAVRQEVQSRVDRAATQLARAAEVKLLLVLDACRSMAQNNVVVNGVVDVDYRSSVTRSFIRSLRLPGSATQKITLADYRGRFLVGNVPSDGYQDASWIDQVISGHEVIATNENAITIAVPVKYGDRPEAIVVVEIPLVEFLSSISLSQSDVLAFQWGDRVIDSSDTELVPLGQIFQQPTGWLSSQADIAKLPGIRVRLLESEDVALQIANVVFMALLLFSILLCLGLVGLIWMLTRQLSEPIDSLLQQITFIGSTGDLKARVDEKVKGPREFLILGEQFNAMLGELQQTTVSQQQYQTAQHQLELAVQGGEIGLWDWDTRGDQVYYSPILKRQLGYPEDEDWSCFSDFESRLHPEDHDRTLQLVQDYLERREPVYSITFRLRSQDGTYRSIFSRGEAKFDAKGRPSRMVGVHIDVTERVRAQERMRLVIEGASTGMVMVNQHGKIELVNSLLEQTFGYSREELLGQPIELLVPVAARQNHVSDRDQFVSSPSPQQMGKGRELSGLNKAGQQFPIEVGLNPIQMDTGMCVLATVVDITDRKQAELALREANEHLARSNSDLEQFAYVASHDLQEPLRKVSSFCDLLKEEYGDKFDEEGTQYIQFIIDGSTRMRALIQDLLSYSRIKNEDTDLVDVDVAGSVKNAIDNLEQAIKESQAVVTVDQMPTIKADLRQLSQMFQNLIGNAIKYRCSDVPNIQIRAESNETGWIFSVADNGIGIEPQYREKVFGVFKRLHDRQSYTGTGIGLAICKRIVDRLGGRIWIEANDPKGTIFRFSVPHHVPKDSYASESVTRKQEFSD